MEDKIKRVPQLIEQLYSVVNGLEQLFPGRRFTPDGHLVGSIGEVLAAYYYNLELLPASSQNHDAKTKDGRMVQIKCTQGDSIGLRGKPDFLIVLKLLPNGKVEEKYNGPGELAWDNAGRVQRNGQRQISLYRLRLVMEKVLPEAMVQKKFNE